MTDILDRCVTGLAYHQSGLLADAEAVYRSILHDEPDHEQALHYLGLLALDMGLPAEAASCWRRVLMIRPDHVPAMVNLANALQRDGDADGAISWCEAALARAPRTLAARMTLGSAFLAKGRVAEAVLVYRASIAAGATAPARAGLAIALLHDGDPQTALQEAEVATLQQPTLADGWFARGTALSTLKRSAEGVVALERAVYYAPRHAHARLNLGNALFDLDRLDEAEAALRHAIALDPRIPEAHASLGCLLAGAGRLAEAKVACATAIRLRPAFATAHWNLSFAHLLDGDFTPGWEEYEWRKQHDRFARDFPCRAGPEWCGEDLSGRTLLVHAEQGLGDTIQFARYLPLLATRGARVILACARPLIALLNPLAEVVDRTETWPAHDFWVDQMSLPRRLATTIDGIPAAGGYLHATPARTAKWAGRLSRGPRVGVVWAGNPEHSNDRRRSLPIEVLAPIFAVLGCEFVSLQVGARSAEITKRFGVADNSADLSDFSETAALVAALDLVIAVDTSTAHLAGALGCPTWVLLPLAPDWRWMTGRADSPWYASVRLFRQTRAGDWSGPIAEIAAALRRYIDRARNPVTSIPMVADTAVATVPQARSTSDTVADQSLSVARLVIS